LFKKKKNIKPIT